MSKSLIHLTSIEASSLERTSDRILKHLTQYSPLIPEPHRESLLAPNTAPSVIRSAVNIQFLSEFPLLLTGQIKFNVPVFTVWGTCEDVVVLEKFRLGTYDIENLHVIDEATTRCLDIGGIKLRILGLGGAFVPHKMFDNGEGSATIAGGQGTMWTTALQIGELVDTAQRVFDNSETRLLLTHASPGREGIITQLALVLKADLTISAGLHFRHSSSWNEFSVQGDFDGFRHKIISGKESIDKIWECVRPQVEAVVDDNQRILLDKALHVVSRVPPQQPHIGPGGNATEEQAWKHCWNWNLCDVYNGSLVLDIKEGRISAELKSQGVFLFILQHSNIRDTDPSRFSPSIGFNYSYRRSGTTAATPNSATSALPNANAPPSSTATPGPPKAQPPPKSNGVSTSASPPPQAAKPQAQQPSAPVSGKDTPKDTKLANGGAGSVASPVDKSSEADKFKNRKEKFKKDKRDGKDRETDGDRPDTPAGSERATPAAADSTDGGSNPMSPVGGENRSRAQTPTGRKPPLRSPWTLHMKAPAEVKESDVREFFGEAQSGVSSRVFFLGIWLILISPRRSSKLTFPIMHSRRHLSPSLSFSKMRML